MSERNIEAREGTIVYSRYDTIYSIVKPFYVFSFGWKMQRWPFYFTFQFPSDLLMKPPVGHGPVCTIHIQLHDRAGITRSDRFREQGESTWTGHAQKYCHN